MSHELRTPLTVLGGYTRLLLTDCSDSLTGEQRKFLEESQVFLNILSQSFFIEQTQCLRVGALQEQFVKLVFVEFLEGCKRLSQAMDIAIQSQHPEARVIPDVFHMHIGGSGFEGLGHMDGDAIAIFQFNDAPASPPMGELKDSHRVFPGDGILPLEKSLRDLRDIGYERCVSLELYNPSYWERDPLEVASEGLEKTLGVIERALA